jgi:hypothetical protein
MKHKKFKLPPITHNASGEERRVGYEFEFTGVEMDEASEIIKSLYGGEIHQLSTYEFNVKETDLGSFKLELDAQLLRDKKYEKVLKTLGIDLTKLKNIDSIEDSLKEMASSIVPFEIITPPIPISKMNELNRLVDELRRHKVKGTGSSFIYAFGLHLNPEIPDSCTESLLNHLRAYVMLDPWIRKDAKINLSRKITPYINEYGEEYILHILNPDYEPSLREFVTDYFKFKNSRNRPLDMLPVFMHLDQELTSSLIKEELTSSRPTYHYRLPNCSLEDETWSLSDEWNRWIMVEKMASDKQVLNQYSRAWLRMKRETLIRFEAKWIKLINRWVHENY